MPNSHPHSSGPSQSVNPIHGKTNPPETLYDNHDSRVFSPKKLLSGENPKYETINPCEDDSIALQKTSSPKMVLSSRGRDVLAAWFNRGIRPNAGAKIQSHRSRRSEQYSQAFCRRRQSLARERSHRRKVLDRLHPEHGKNRRHFSFPLSTLYPAGLSAVRLDSGS